MSHPPPIPTLPRSLGTAAAAGVLLGLQGVWGGPGVGVALAAVLTAATVRGHRSDLIAGLLLGVVWHAVALMWLPAAWARLGGPAWGPAALVAWQALPVAVAVAATGWATRRGVPLPLASALCWAAADGMVDRWDVLPWTPAVLLVGSPAVTWPAAWAGRAALSGLCMGWGALAWHRPRWAVRVLVGVVALGVLAPTAETPQTPLRVGLVQPDVGALEGRRPSSAPDRAARLRRGIDRAASWGADLVVTPEGAWPVDPGDGPGQRRTDLRTAFAGTPPVVLGATVGAGTPTNSLLVVHGGDVTGRVDKRWRVPVAERRWLGVGRDRYRAGRGPRELELPGGRATAWVCFEDLFARAAAQAAPSAFGIAATNDAWLGPRGSAQHLAAAQLLAVTTRRWLVRPALSGPSALIDPWGRIHWQTAWVDGDAVQGEPTVAVLTVRRSAPRWWGGRLDPVLPAAAALALLALAARRRST